MAVAGWQSEATWQMAIATLLPPLPVELELSDNGQCQPVSLRFILGIKPWSFTLNTVTHSEISGDFRHIHRVIAHFYISKLIVNTTDMMMTCG